MKKRTIKGVRTYASIGAIATLIVAQKLRTKFPPEIADLLASEAVTYVELGFAAAAAYFRKKATAEHTDTQDTPTAGPKFEP